MELYYTKKSHFMEGKLKEVALYWVQLHINLKDNPQ